MTFSVAGRCETTGMLGVAITTSSICAGSRCPRVRAGTGAVSSQNVTDPRLGALVLDALAGGLDAERALARVLEGHAYPEYRQVTVVDACGRAAIHSGARTLGTNAHALGEGCVAAGNLLADARVPAAMTERFAAGAGEHLAERLLASLEAGVAAGGEEGDVHSAALLVAGDQSWPLVDLRVDWHDDAPVAALRALWTRYAPQAAEYVTRALEPARAPAFGVPGDP